MERDQAAQNNINNIYDYNSSSDSIADNQDNKDTDSNNESDSHLEDSQQESR